MRILVAAIVVTGAAAAVWWHTCGLASHAAQRDNGIGKVVVDCTCTRVLNDFDSERMREALLRQLCASAEWRVTAVLEIAGAEKHVKRVIEAEQCRPCAESVNGDQTQIPASTLKVVLRFDSSLPVNLRSGGYTLAKAGAKAVDVALFPAPDDSRTVGSTLVIEGKSLILRIDDYEAEHDRKLTEETLQHVADELSAVKCNVSELDRVGYLRKWLPKGSIRDSAVQLPLQIRELSRGIYWVSGYVNPGEKGYITIRTFHVPTGKELDADENSWRTIQYVGWSSRPNEKFAFGCEIPAPSYLTEEESKMDPDDPRYLKAMEADTNVRVEVWFHGTRERKLLETTKVLTPYMR